MTQHLYEFFGRGLPLPNRQSHGRCLPVSLFGESGQMVTPLSPAPCARWPAEQHQENQASQGKSHRYLK
jgi:hypothetical protein